MRPDEAPPARADDVLAQPTRRRLFALLTATGGAATTDDLAARLGLHPNGVRTHLQRMCDAGLVERRRVPQSRGRPRDEWAIAPGAPAPPEEPSAYAPLARWLARTIPATPQRLREVEATGREIGRELAAGAPPGPPGPAVGAMLATLGFHPRVEADAGDRFACRLGTCPYRESARENQAVVCTLHRGVTRGLLDRLAPGARLARFVPHDPDRAGCEIEIEGLDPGGGAPPR